MSATFANKSYHKHVTDYELDMFTGITTFHGLVRIYHSKNWLSKAFWILLTIVCFLLFCFQVLFFSPLIPLIGA
jgi:Amiloride-sensitive sodium channel